MVWNPDKQVLCFPARHDDALNGNPNLYAYQHLTNTFFYPYVNGEYLTDQIDFKIFQDKFIDDPAVSWSADQNHSYRYKSFILNLEENSAGNPETATYRDINSQYMNAARMLRTQGKNAAIYGLSLGPLEYNRWYNIGRYTWRLDPDLNPNYQDQLAHSKEKIAEFRADERKLMLPRLQIMSNLYKGELDAMVLDLYQFYNIPNLTSEAFYSWRNMTRRKAECYRRFFPDQELWAFIQPNYTDNFDPIQNDVWDAMVAEVHANTNIDRIYVFTTSTTTGSDGWQDVLINGPQATVIS